MTKLKRMVSSLLSAVMMTSLAFMPANAENNSARYTAYLADFEQPTYSLGAFTGYSGTDTDGMSATIMPEDTNATGQYNKMNLDSSNPGGACLIYSIGTHTADSVSVKFRYNLSKTNNKRYIFFYDENGQELTRILFNKTGDLNTCYIYAGADACATANNTSPTQMSNGEWHDIEVIFHKSNGGYNSAEYYVDGAAVNLAGHSLVKTGCTSVGKMGFQVPNSPNYPVLVDEIDVGYYGTQPLPSAKAPEKVTLADGGIVSFTPAENDNAKAYAVRLYKNNSLISTKTVLKDGAYTADFSDLIENNGFASFTATVQAKGDYLGFASSEEIKATEKISPLRYTGTVIDFERPDYNVGDTKITDVSSRINGEIMAEDNNATGQYLKIERISTAVGNYGYLDFPVNGSGSIVSIRFKINIAYGSNERYVYIYDANGKEITRVLFARSGDGKICNVIAGTDARSFNKNDLSLYEAYTKASNETWHDVEIILKKDETGGYNDAEFYIDEMPIYSVASGIVSAGKTEVGKISFSLPNSMGIKMFADDINIGVYEDNLLIGTVPVENAVFTADKKVAFIPKNNDNAKAYAVELYRNGKLFSTKTVLPDEESTVDFSKEIDMTGRDGYFTASVTAKGDYALYKDSEKVYADGSFGEYIDIPGKASVPVWNGAVLEWNKAQYASTYTVTLYKDSAVFEVIDGVGVGFVDLYNYMLKGGSGEYTATVAGVNDIAAGVASDLSLVYTFNEAMTKPENALHKDLISKSVYNGNGLDFSSGELEVRTNKTLPAAPRTVEAWIKLGKDAVDHEGVILGSFDTGLCMPAMFDFGISKNGNPRIYYYNANKDVYDFNIDFDARLDEYVHIAITMNSFTNKLICYVNGVKYSEISCDIPSNVPELPFAIGQNYIFTNPCYFPGEIADVRVWSKVRTAKEISDNMLTLTDTDGLMGRWMLDDGKDGVYPDSSQNANDAKEWKQFLEPEIFEGDYSFVFVPDTQELSRNHIDIFNGLTTWIKDNKEKYNIKCVLGLGDIVQSNSSDAQWQIAKDAYSILDGIVPHIPLPGNHDRTSRKEEDFSQFNTYFPYEDFKDKEYFGGSFPEGTMNSSYHYFTVGGVKYMMLALVDYPSETDIVWANSVISANSDCNVIITTHEYLDYSSTRTAVGENIWTKLASLHENIIAVVCGHVEASDIAVGESVGVNGNKVLEILADAQAVDSQHLRDDTTEKAAMLMIMTFSEGSNEIKVNWYSTKHNILYRPENQFTREIELDYISDIKYITVNDDNTLTVALDEGKALENSETLFVAAYDENYNLTNVSLATKDDINSDGTYTLSMIISEDTSLLNGIILQDTETIKPICDVFQKSF